MIDKYTFQLWRWTLLGAFYGALPVPLLFLYGDVSAALADGGTWASIRPGAFREWRNAFIMFFLAAILPAYYVARVYQRRCAEGRMTTFRQRLALIQRGALAGTLLSVAIAPPFEWITAGFAIHKSALERAAFSTVLLGVPTTILGGVATALLIWTEKWWSTSNATTDGH